MATGKTLFQNYQPKPVSDVKPTMKAKKGQLISEPIHYSSNIYDIEEKLRSQGFLTTQKLTFLVHGFTDSYDGAWMEDMQNYMVQKDPTQSVVSFDWRKGTTFDILALGWQITSFSAFPWTKEIANTVTNAVFGQTWCNDWLTVYHKAAATTQTVGQWLGDVARKIKERHPTIQIRGVGHSLGAHLLGKAGRSSRVFSRITGLDPAGPDFEEPSGARDKMLSASCADFVDVIHTNGFSEDRLRFLYRVNHFGTLIPLGDVDFYPNYGTKQPENVFSKIGGSHSRVLDYFIYSIKNEGAFTTNQLLDGTPDYDEPVKATKEGRSAEMGYYCKDDTRGSYYISIPESMVPKKY